VAFWQTAGGKPGDARRQYLLGVYIARPLVRARWRLQKRPMTALSQSTYFTTLLERIIGGGPTTAAISMPVACRHNLEELAGDQTI
jgi:hypothetical protein